MTIWQTNQTAANTSSTALTVRKTKALSIPISVNGLQPNSKYTFTYNTQDVTWATKQSGQKMGANGGLISTANGNLSFQYFVELNNNLTSSQNMTKTHSFQIKDIQGNVAAVGQLQQKLTVRT